MSQFRIGAALAVLAALIVCPRLGPLIDESSEARSHRETLRYPADKSTAAISTASAADSTGQHLGQAGVSGLSPLPTSLAGTEVRGTLQYDAAGNLIVTEDLRYVFDYFLSADGEEALEQIVLRIKAHIQAFLPPPAAATATQILERYLTYRRGVLELDESITFATLPDGQKDLATVAGVDAVKQYLSEREKLRRETLGADVAQTLFGERQAYDSYSLAMVELHRRADLTAARRAAAIHELADSLPESLREVRKANDVGNTLRTTDLALAKRNATAGEIYAARAELVGDEAAARLAQLDESRQVWQQRRRAYLQIKQQIDRHAGVTAAEKQRLLRERATRELQLSDKEYRRLQVQDSTDQHRTRA